MATILRKIIHNIRIFLQNTFAFFLRKRKKEKKNRSNKLEKSCQVNYSLREEHEMKRFYGRNILKKKKNIYIYIYIYINVETFDIFIDVIYLPSIMVNVEATRTSKERRTSGDWE